jgi:3-phosphoshikimate 1-carboxyvinyltransferase
VRFFLIVRGNSKPLWDEGDAVREAPLAVRPAKRIAGTLRPPGDKSISHRYAMLAAIAHGASRLRNFASGADCVSTLACLGELGVPIERNAGEVRITGRNGSLAAPLRALDCGNSGSTMRMLAGILAGQEFTVEMTGDASLRRRPMERIVTPLTEMGAAIVATDGMRPPLRIRGGRLHGVEYQVPVASAQVKSCLLFAGLAAEGTTSVDEPVRTRDHGELALAAFGAQVERRALRVSIAGGQRLSAIESEIPGDISSAAFFLCAACALPGSELDVEDVGLNPTRTALLDLLAGMGAHLSFVHIEERHGEVAGNLRISVPARLRGGAVSGAQTAALIDELPVLAAIAPFTEQGIEINDAQELRVKESDRIATVARNLRAMGAEVEEKPDGLRVPGRQRLRGAEIDASGDHRIAMALAVAALAAEGVTRITGARAADVSYPGFFTELDRLVER